MKIIVSLSVVLLSIFASHSARAAEGHYTGSMFERAVKETTSPRYVLVQVQGPRASSTQTVCIRGNALVEAIQIEHDWNYTILGRTRAKWLAMSHWRKPFVFEKPNALARVTPRYTPHQLTGMRARLSRFTNRELKSQLRPRHWREQTELQKICASKETPIAYSCRAAIAHVLLERGILVAIDDRTGHLRLP